MKGSIKLLGVALLAATASQVFGADMFDAWIAKGVRPGMNNQQVYALTGQAIKGTQMAGFNEFYAKHLTSKKAAGGDEGVLASSVLGETVDPAIAARGRSALVARLQAEVEAQKLAAAAPKAKGAGTPAKTPAVLLEEGLVAGGVEATAAKFLATTFMTGSADDFCPETATIKKDDRMATASEFGAVANELKDIIPGLEPKAGTHFINLGLVGLAIQDVLKDAPDLLTAITTKTDTGLFQTAAINAHLTNSDDLATVLRNIVVARYTAHRAAVDVIRTNATAFTPGSDWSAGFNAAEDIAAPVLAALGTSATWTALKAKMA